MTELLPILQKALAERYLVERELPPELILIPMLDPIRSDPRFVQVLKRMGLEP